MTISQARQELLAVVCDLDEQAVRTVLFFSKVYLDESRGRAAMVELAALKAAGVPQAKQRKPRKVKLGGNVVALRPRAEA